MRANLVQINMGKGGAFLPPPISSPLGDGDTDHLDGTYGFVYCGAIGVGMGVFRVQRSTLAGVDIAGARYRGTISSTNTDQLHLAFEMAVPAGVMLVQGTAPQDIPYTKSASVTVDSDFGEGRPFEVYVPPGKVTMMVRRIPDDCGWIADGISITITPAR
jgi:hypothetical protein